MDVFFVISGYLISGIIVRSMERGRFSFRSFYVHRICRLFPALLVVLSALIAAGWLLLLPDEFATLGKHVLAGCLYVSNFALWQEAGYFDTSAELKPLLHLWSLAVEEQFYLIWPPLLLLAWRARSAILLVVLETVLASFAAALLFAREYSVATFFLPGTRVWELGSARRSPIGAGKATAAEQALDGSARAA